MGTYILGVLRLKARPDVSPNCMLYMLYEQEAGS